MSSGNERGYRKPPAEHQFKPGKSGNPLGRPRKPRFPKLERSLGYDLIEDLDKIILDQANRLVKIQDAGKTTRMPLQAVVFRKLMQNGLAGDSRALKEVLSIIGKAQREKTKREEDEMRAIVAYKHGAEAEIRRRKAAGQSIEDILPHPDDIELGFDNGTITIFGPRTPRERAELDDLIEWRDDLNNKVLEAARRHLKAESPAKRRASLEDWHDYQREFDFCNDRLPVSLRVKISRRSTEPGATKAGCFELTYQEWLRREMNPEV